MIIVLSFFKVIFPFWILVLCSLLIFSFNHCSNVALIYINAFVCRFFPHFVLSLETWLCSQWFYQWFSQLRSRRYFLFLLCLSERGNLVWHIVHAYSLCCIYYTDKWIWSHLQDKTDFEISTLPALVPVLSSASGDTLLLLVKHAELIINKVIMYIPVIMHYNWCPAYMTFSFRVFVQFMIDCYKKVGKLNFLDLRLSFISICLLCFALAELNNYP